MDSKEAIKKILERALKDIGINDVPEILVETSKEVTHGDYSSTIALALSKKVGKNSLEVAQEIAARIKKPAFLEKIEVVIPGFINFYLSKEVFVENIKTILNEKDNFGKNAELKNKKVIIEYTDPNILKEFHIGHLMSNTIGESLSRIFEFQGAKVKRACYQSDVGIGIAKAVWGKMENPHQSWQEAYVKGNEAYDQNNKAKEEIISLNRAIYERKDKEINTLYDKGKKESLAFFERIYQLLGTQFDYYFFESQVADAGKKIVEKSVNKVFEKGEKGAIIFKGENVGLHTRVFVNAEGLPTYEAKELALAQEKYKKYKYDTSVIVTGNEVNAYFKVLLSAMSQLFPDLAKNTKHIGHGMMRLPEGKMSSRTGKVVTFEFLLSEVEKLVSEKIKDRDLSEEEKKDIVEKVAIGALKYSVLKQSIGGDIIYDFEKSISFQGDSGPYLQYSFVRAKSVLEKGKTEKVALSIKNVPAKISGLERKMQLFPLIVEKAGKEYEPHIVTLYLTELASEFNAYYAQNKIVDKEDEFSPYKIALTQAFSIIIKNGLWLLGIPVPEKM